MEPQINIPQEKLIPSLQVTQGSFLGQGGYGRVYKAKWNGDTVAVKRLILEKMNIQAQSEFEQEITLHMKLSHPRVVRLYGVIAEAGESYGMVMEYAAKGSLFNLLESTKQSELGWDKRKIIAVDMIAGLQYLHQNGIIHRDLKSLNVLLDKKCRAQLADFGLSKVRSQTSSQSDLQLKGTIQFLAPELLSSFRPKYDNKTDIYAYGMVLWELATHEIPYGDTKSDIVLNLVKQGQREEFPDVANIPLEYQQLTELCWAQKPIERPTVENIQKLLDKMEFGKSKLKTSQTALTGSMQNSGGYAIKTETMPSKSKELNQSPGQSYVLESQTIGPQNNSSQGGYALKTETVLSKSQTSIKSNLQQNNSEANYTLALQHINQSQYLQAVPLLEEAAKQGHAKAQHQLGLCYHSGLGLPANLTQAVKYFRLAAEQGNARGQCSLGYCYHKGQGVTQDYTQAVKYYRLAADQGHAKAQQNLGFCYYKGQGITKDYAQAVKYFCLSADQGDGDAQYYLGNCYDKGEGVTLDHTRAAKYFRLSADQGNAYAQRNLEVCYAKGQGVTQDTQKGPAQSSLISPALKPSLQKPGIKSVDPLLFKEINVLKGHSGTLHALIELSNGTLVSGSRDKTIKLWDPKSGKCLNTLSGHSGFVCALTLLSDETLASGSSDNTIKLWDPYSGKCLKTLQEHLGVITGLIQLSDGTLASGSYDKTIKIWNLKTGKCLKTLGGHSKEITALIQLLDGTLVSGSYDKTIKLWDLKTGKCLKTLKGHSATISALTSLSDGTFASGSFSKTMKGPTDKTIKLWDSKKESCLKNLKGHSETVNALIQLADGTLASGSKDNTIKLWNLKKGKCLKTLQGHLSDVIVLFQLSDGTLVSGSNDTTIRIWGTDFVSHEPKASTNNNSSL